MFAVVTVALILLVSTIVFSEAAANSSGNTTDAVEGVLQTGIEMSVIVPLVLVAGIALAAVGVFGR
jgi:peptidoglycan biosynthesis protein MviN/MurJ (putative lipid II flippase)